MKKPLLIILFLAVIGACGFWIYRNRPGRTPTIQMDPYRALGDVAGEETARLAQGRGEVVIVARENPDNADTVEAAELKSFCNALQTRGVHVRATETFRVPPTALYERGSIPRERLLQVLDAHPGVAAFVLFAGLPPLEQGDLERLKQSGARTILICGYQPSDKTLLDSGVIQLAIVPRTDSAQETAPASKTTRGIFDRHYVLLSAGETAQNQ